VWNWLLEKQVVTSKPAFLKVEISRQCGLACPYCLAKKEDGVFFPLEEYQKLVDELKDYLFMVSLYDIGESLENPRLVEYIRYAKSSNIGTAISTHLSLEREDHFWEELACSGLDRLIVAIDGVTPEVYTRYRKNGNLELVLSNLRKVINFRNLNKMPMKIEWQMIRFPWNIVEIETARRMCKEIGCDSFRVIQDSSVRKSYKKATHIRRRNCILPYLVFIVDAYYRIRPCYKFYGVPNFTGDYKLGGVEGNWNNTQIQVIRCGKTIGSRTPCDTCIES